MKLYRRVQSTALGLVLALGTFVSLNDIVKSDKPTRERVEALSTKSSAAVGATGKLAEGLAQAAPSITYVLLKGKKLIVRGSDFGNGAVIWVDGISQKTKNDGEQAESVLVAAKAGKRIALDRIARLQVQNPDGLVSEEFAFYTGCGSSYAN